MGAIQLSMQASPVLFLMTHQSLSDMELTTLKATHCIF